MTPEEILEQAFVRFLNNVMGSITDKSLPELEAWKAALLNMVDMYQNQINNS